MSESPDEDDENKLQSIYNVNQHRNELHPNLIRAKIEH